MSGAPYLTGRTRLAGIMGWPVGHSLSPRLHGHWLRRYGIDGAYVPLAVPPERLEQALRALPALGFRGCNLTIPHKEAALALVDSASPLARRIGAINTVVVEPDATLSGDNTDGFGFLANLAAGCPGWRAEAGPAVLLGAGGAARAVAVALLDAGAPEVRLLNRTPDRARQLAAELAGPVAAVPWAERALALDDAALLVNTTSLGMTGQPPLGPGPRRAAADRAGHRRRLHAADHAAARGRAGARQPGGRRPRHAAAPGAARFPGLVRGRSGGRRRAARRGPGGGRQLAAMFVLGLTGSIAMGKSTAAKIFRSLGVPVFDADADVHGLLAPGGAAVEAVGAAFPDCRSDGAIDRGRLARLAFGDAAALARLEAILHPLVRDAERRFLARAAAARRPLVVLDIPLLFETGSERRVDAVAVVSAPAFLQRQRVLRRAGMTAERLAAIGARQLPDAEKRRRADFVIATGLDRRRAVAAIAAIVAALRDRPGGVQPHRRPARRPDMAALPG